MDNAHAKFRAARDDKGGLKWSTHWFMNFWWFESGVSRMSFHFFLNLQDFFFQLNGCNVMLQDVKGGVDISAVHLLRVT